MAERSYLFLEKVLINQDIIIDICSNKVLVEENNIVVNHSLIDLDTFFLFYKYLQNKEEFTKKFSMDTFINRC
jgi:hypothetical protein